MMFASRSRKEHRDRHSGLSFAWRLPVGDSFRLCAAALVVALAATGFAAAVRVRIGESGRPLERRASFALVPAGGEWKALRMQALEAGPFPAATRLAEDPDFLSVLDTGLRNALTPGIAYRPQWREVPDPADVPPPPPPSLPPLPALKPQPAAVPVPATPPLIVPLGAGAIEAPPTPPPAITGRSRYLLSYRPDGRISEAIGLDAEAAADPDDAVAAWIRRARVTGGDRNGGWIAVEVEP